MLAIALVPIPGVVPLALPLVVAGSISRSLRGRSWNEVMQGGGTRVMVGFAAGALALGIALVLGNQSLNVLYAGAGDQIVAVIDLAGTGQTSALVIAVVAIALIAFATELALRGWIVERVLELSPGSPVLPVIVGALAEALVTPGDAPVRISAAVFGAGLGWIYVAGGRSVVAPACARALFQCGAVTLEALRLV